MITGKFSVQTNNFLIKKKVVMNIMLSLPVTHSFSTSHNLHQLPFNVFVGSLLLIYVIFFYDKKENKKTAVYAIR
jgi:hypothetical protein